MLESKINKLEMWEIDMKQKLKMQESEIGN